MLLHGLGLDLTGWFQVGWSGDIGPEQVVPLRYFGRDLVAYRGKDGIVRVHDRHCRHRTEIFATYWIDRVACDLADGTYRRRLDEAKLALPDDVAIWNHQIFLDPPVLATEEGSGFRRIRRWARQFYPGDSGNAPTGTDDTRSPAVGKLEANAS